MSRCRHHRGDHRHGPDLNITVTAEGVENAAQADFLARCGCEQTQGFYFARPMPAEAITVLLQERGAIRVAQG